MNYSNAVHIATQIGRNRVPGQLIIQYTNHCNALCPQCGMNVHNKIKRTRLDDEAIYRLIDAAAAKRFEAISFTGGEPLMHWNKLRDYIKAAGKAGIKYIRTGTNGYVFANSHKPDFESKIKKLADEMAETPIRNFWISIDSAVPAVHEKMRGLPGVVDGIERALPIFHERGIYPSANLGINRNIGGDNNLALHHGQTAFGDGYIEAFGREFGHSLEKFYNLVIGLGFTMVNACYPMSLDEESGSDAMQAVYAATSVDRVVKFSTEERIAIFKAVLEAVPKFRSKVRIFSPLSSVYALYKQYSNINASDVYPCRGGHDFFFVDSDTGQAYACGYRGGESLGRFEDIRVNKRPQEKPNCRLCDWECFRDPSELLGPFLDLLSSPVGLAKKWKRDPRALSYWLSDISYYRACGFFDGRRSPNMGALRRFKNKPEPTGNGAETRLIGKQGAGS